MRPGLTLLAALLLTPSALAGPLEEAVDEALDHVERVGDVCMEDGTVRTGPCHGQIQNPRDTIKSIRHVVNETRKEYEPGVRDLPTSCWDGESLPEWARLSCLRYAEYVRDCTGFDLRTLTPGPRTSCPQPPLPVLP